MSEPNNSKPFDPFEAWRDMRDDSLDAWSKLMIQTVNSEEYAKASGAMLDTCLTASIPFAEMLKKAMAQALQQANMPTRADIVSLAERMTQMEMRIDDIDAKIDEFRARESKPREPAPPKPRARSKSKEGE